MANRWGLAFAAIALVLIFGFGIQVGAYAVDAATGDPFLDSLLNGSGGVGATKEQKAAQKATTKTSNTGTTTDSGTTGSTTTSGTDTAGTGTTNTGTSGPAIVPAATPLVVSEYTTTPSELQSGSRFKLALKVENPGQADAEDVVVQIGPPTGAGWGSTDELVVLGTGSSKFVGTIAAGDSADGAEFDLLANPSMPGGPRSVPVKMTWQAAGYEHTSSAVVGLLVNSMVDVEAAIATKVKPVQKVPFPAIVAIRNSTSRTLKGVTVVFSGKGARPSKGTTQTVGDLPGGVTKTVVMNYTAPLPGRAKLLARVSYVDDFGGVRTLPLDGWAKVQRAALDTGKKSSSMVQRIEALFAALLGLSGSG